ncbi:uridine kinase [Limibacter armeniacum]|uniref:uridine kinase n=1 Tax=Limibacter armeniacum TaxID=466084 RepID=UPI002FE600D6
MNNCIFVGVAGGTGSGKSTVSHELMNIKKGIVQLEQDAYYKDLKGLSVEERAKTNFDHPDSIDFDLLISHILELKKGNAIERPVYDFTTHSRKKETIRIEPAQLVIVDGILIFAIPELRKLLDMKIFVDTDDDERLLRRIERDIKERGRTFESVKEQYLKTVKPMHLEFVEPSKRYADVIIPRGGKNRVAVNMVIAKMKRILQKGHMD